MKTRLTPIAAAVLFSLTSQVYAAGGANGANGDLIRLGLSQSLSNETLTGTAGSNGENPINAQGGGGNGGHGGSSVIGYIFSGASGGQSQTLPEDGNDAGGGAGSNLKLTNVTLDGVGASGGNGGSLSGSSSNGGTGAAGHGGGSVVGGISTGGAGGYSYRRTISYSANGGDGGSISDNIIEIIDSTLTGGAGGDGGSAYANGSWTGGGGGAAGHGGGSVFGGISTGGSGGQVSTLSTNVSTTASAVGGDGGSVSNNTIEITNSTLTGAVGGTGGSLSGTFDGGGGAAGHGGSSVFGGISIGGAGGFADTNATTYSSADGGAGGSVSGNKITLHTVQLDGSGAVGGAGGSAISGGGGAGGHGGGSVFGGLSIGGAGGRSYISNTSAISSLANGGDGGNISGNTIEITDSTLTGANGGDGGSIASQGSGGAAGNGGGSVFGGISTGGAGGVAAVYGSAFSSNGGDGGSVSNNTIEITNSTLTGSYGGDGGSTSFRGSGGAAGHGGGSVFGGISTGGGGGYSSASDRTTYVNGGHGGNVSGNIIKITDSTLTGGIGGDGGQGSGNGGNGAGGNGASGYDGGSVFGGISTGGAGGFGNSSAAISDGGNGGNVFNNNITISGVSNISGDIYGGISQGGANGLGKNGAGRLAQENIITLIGPDITIGGSLYGGLSINGDGNPNKDPNFTNFYKGNTLNVKNYHGTVQGINNFQYYNWILPKDNFDGDVIFTIDNKKDLSYKVNVDNTIHTVNVMAKGNVLDGGDTIILINKATGNPSLSNNYAEQGFFIIYDAEFKIEADQLVLKILGVDDNIPDGKIHPEAEALLNGRVAQLAMIDHGADMISDYGIGSARASLRNIDANLFLVVDGGSNRYKTSDSGTIKIQDFKFSVGAAKAFEFGDQSVGMVGVFAEHGNGNYDSHSNLGIYGDVKASGKTRYTGVGALFHVDVGGTDVSKVQNKPNIFDDKYGLYFNGALRFGHTKMDFHSSDIVNGEGVQASYNTKSRYVTAMAGAGYVWTLNAKSAVDLYGRYTFSWLNGKDVQVVDESMRVGSAHSQRLRVGVRYGYEYSDKVTPYAGVAYERNFKGDVSGSAYDLTIKEQSLKGNTGIVEFGVLVKPKGADDPFSLHLGVQGYFGDRKGAAAAIKARYVF